MTVQIRAFDSADADAVVGLWQFCGLTRPWNDPYRDIARKLEVQRELFLVAEDAGVIVGTVMAGYDGHRGSVFYLAVAPHRQGGGIGRHLMSEVEARLLALGCPKLNLLVRTSNSQVLGFYRAIGYGVEEVVGLGRRLLHDPKPP
jgi:ribosomal protein S18 acetylase RimI-like enzyme